MIEGRLSAPSNKIACNLRRVCAVAVMLSALLLVQPFTYGQQFDGDAYQSVAAECVAALGATTNSMGAGDLTTARSHYDVAALPCQQSRAMLESALLSGTLSLQDTERLAGDYVGQVSVWIQLTADFGDCASAQTQLTQMNAIVTDIPSIVQEHYDSATQRVLSCAPTPTPTPTPYDSGGLCTDTCSWAFDGECDDGGPGSLYAICEYGTDCSDCGVRTSTVTPTPTPTPTSMPTPYDTTGGLCTNTCSYAFDGECDDGGPGSLYDICEYGSDCGDCGVRTGSAPTPTPYDTTGGLCTNTCSWAFDGECDDGGPGSLYNICEYGSDCGDCGVRTGSAPTPTPYDTTGGLCTNTCSWAFDGECDDGGPGSLYNICEYGSDCGDCGIRTGSAPTPTPYDTTGGLCTNTCSWAFDGECDDGGPGSLYNICEYGSDCGDCGVRTGSAPTPTPYDTTGGLCTNTCSWAFDGECDDGGPGSLYDICEYGSDCGDCGVRTGSAPTPTPYDTTGGLCTNTCSYAFDGECDDGGPGSLYDICEYGSDCGDCGVRTGSAPTPTPYDTTGGLCTNTCSYAFDGECDDGGPGSLYDICEYGSDCGDCGVRTGSAPTPTPYDTTGGLCTNTCSYAFDGECDDGGPGSLYDICEYGSDCGDCGVRSGSGVPTPSPYETGGFCTNTCTWAFDGECDDGGPGSMYSICDFGTDCGDCGVRY